MFAGLRQARGPRGLALTDRSAEPGLHLVRTTAALHSLRLPFLIRCSIKAWTRNELLPIPKMEQVNVWNFTAQFMMRRASKAKAPFNGDGALDCVGLWPELRIQRCVEDFFEGPFRACRAN
jgi:hypothetical protein